MKKVRIKLKNTSQVKKYNEVLKKASKITREEFKVNENMLMWAFRYALGRRTGAVDSVVEHLKIHWKKLKPFTQQQIKNEIHTAITMARAGDKCDIESWKEIKEL